MQSIYPCVNQWPQKEQSKILRKDFSIQQSYSVWSSVFCQRGIAHHCIITTGSAHGQQALRHTPLLPTPPLPLSLSQPPKLHLPPSTPSFSTPCLAYFFLAIDQCLQRLTLGIHHLWCLHITGKAYSSFQFKIDCKSNMLTPLPLCLLGRYKLLCLKRDSRQAEHRWKVSKLTVKYLYMKGLWSLLNHSIRAATTI